jgi:hypothetical protein
MNRKMGDLSDFERGHIVGARLAGACHKKKNCQIISVPRATVPKVTLTYTNHGKTTSTKRKSVRKSTLTERDCRTLMIVSEKHETTATQVNCSRTEYSS